MKEYHAMMIIGRALYPGKTHVAYFPVPHIISRINKYICVYFFPRGNIRKNVGSWQIYRYSTIFNVRPFCQQKKKKKKKSPRFTPQFSPVCKQKPT